MLTGIDVKTSPDSRLVNYHRCLRRSTAYRPELPVIGEKQTIKGRHSSFSTRYKTTRDFIDNQRMLFDPHEHEDLSHAISSRTIHYTCMRKIRLFETAQGSVQNTHIRNKSVVFGLECSFLAHKSAYLHNNTQNKPAGSNIIVDNL